jgi:HD-GYP domain-containing protein (c-di-GMP phosphodiesterase class II)
MNKNNNADAPPGAATHDNDRHYLNAVAEVGDTRKLAVAHSIYSANGIKLLDAGATLTSRTLERLVGHRLAAPIEHNLTAEGALRPAEIVARTRDLVQAQPLLSHFESTGADADRLYAALANAPLPPSVLFRLTVAREKFASLYEHSLRAAFVASFLGCAASLGERELELLATAALLHDFGMLHADPARFDRDQPLDAAARRQLRAHPLTGMLIAQREPQLNPAIATAILQHHERLDGSGYPTMPAADEITRLARILMLVEVVLAMVEHRPNLPELQLSLILRANHRGFDRTLAGLLLAALPRVQATGGSAASLENAVQKIGKLLADWEAARPRDGAGPEQDASAFVTERLARLRRFLAEAGIDLNGNAAASAAAADDATALAELNGLMSEALWHVRQIAYETTSRWPQVAAQPDTGAPLQTWLHSAGATPGADA